MYSLKHAHQIIEKIPGCTPYIFYMDIRSFGKMYEEFYYRIQDEGAKFIRGRVANILEDPVTKNLHVHADDTLLDRPVDMDVDLVVLAAQYSQWRTQTGPASSSVYPVRWMDGSSKPTRN